MRKCLFFENENLPPDSVKDACKINLLNLCHSVATRSSVSVGIFLEHLRNISLKSSNNSGTFSFMKNCVDIWYVAPRLALGVNKFE